MDGGSVCDATTLCVETIVGGGLLAALVTIKVGDGVGESAALGNGVIKVPEDTVSEPRTLADAVGKSVFDAVGDCVGNAVGYSVALVGEAVEGLIEYCSRPGEFVVVGEVVGISVDHILTVDEYSVLEPVGAIV